MGAERRGSRSRITEARLANKAQRAVLYVAQDGKCALCKAALTATAEADHVVPFSQKGETKLWNLQLLCRTCHLQKHFA